MNMQYARGISTAFHVRKLCIRPRHELVPQRCDSRRLQARAALAVGLEGIDASTASEVVNALKVCDADGGRTCVCFGGTRLCQRQRCTPAYMCGMH